MTDTAPVLTLWYAISTHTPLAGRDVTGLALALGFTTFLLTRPSRDVTSLSFSDISKHGFLLTRPSRDVTARSWRLWPTPRFLLTRPSRDVTKYSLFQSRQEIFLLTRPSRDVTYTCQANLMHIRISTHTPLAGRDYTEEQIQELVLNFYSHAPRGT